MVGFAQENNSVPFSNTSYITNNNEAIDFLINIFSEYQRGPVGPGVRLLNVNKNQIKLYNPLTAEKLDCVHAYLSVKRSKTDADTGYETKISVTLSLLLPFSTYLRNYRETIDTISSDDQVIELLRQAAGFSMQISSGINVVGRNFSVDYSSPGYMPIHREVGFLGGNPFVIFRNLLDIGNHVFSNYNLLNLTDKSTVIDSLSALLSSNRPYGYDQGKFLLLGVRSPRDRTFIDINKIGDNPPFNIAHYRRAITTGRFQNMTIMMDNFIMDIEILFNDTDLKMLESLPKNNALGQLAQRSRYNGSYYYIGQDEFISLMRRSIEFRICIKKSASDNFDSNNDLYIEYATQNFSLIPSHSNNLENYYNETEFRNIVNALDTINMAVENGIKFVWKGNRWDYE
jgi:hypothetical protein